MTPSENGELQDWLDARIEAYVDGELCPADGAELERYLTTGMGEHDVRMSRRVRDGLRSLSSPMLPVGASRYVLERARAESDSVPVTWLRWIARGLWTPVLRPVFAMALLVLVVVSAVLIGRPVPVEQISATAEVQQALAEAKWALAYVSHVGRETGSSVRSEVLQPHVVRPMQQALGIVLDEQHKTELR